jgi:hypothetical protein
MAGFMERLPQLFGSKVAAVDIDETKLAKSERLTSSVLQEWHASRAEALLFSRLKLALKNADKPSPFVFMDIPADFYYPDDRMFVPASKPTPPQEIERSTWKGYWFINEKLKERGLKLVWDEEKALDGDEAASSLDNEGSCNGGGQAVASMACPSSASVVTDHSSLRSETRKANPSKNARNNKRAAEHAERKAKRVAESGGGEAVGANVVVLNLFVV